MSPVFSRFAARCGLAFAALTVLSLGALAADKKILASSVTQTPRSVVVSTTSMQPQIQPMSSPRRQIPENEDPVPIVVDPMNSLVAGGMTNQGRIAPKITFKGPGFTGYVPPDCDMAVGPTHVVAVVNTRIAFFTKSNGTKLFEQDMDQNGFFSGVGQSSEIYADPKVFYDKVTNRFFVFILEVNGLFGGTPNRSRVLLAVSDDGNPVGNWHQYSIDALITVGGNQLWLDYPTVGLNKDAIAIGGNMFGFTAGGGVAQTIVLRKTPLLTGAATTVTSFQEPGGSTIQYARSWDAASDKLFGVSRGNGSTLKIYALQNLAATPTLTQTTIQVPTYRFPQGLAPSAGGAGIDQLDGRVFTCAYRAGRLVAAHTIAPVAGSIGRARWYQVAVNSWPTSGQPTLVQSGDVTAPSGAYAHMPAVNVNAAGDISMLYTVSSSSIGADLMRTGRKSSDPPGTMGVGVKVKGSTGAYNQVRWGDYFAVAIDPQDDITFWGFGMNIAPGGVWDTTVTSWQISTGGVTGTIVPADTITTVTGTYLIGDPASVSSSNDIFYQIGSEAVPQFGQAAAAEATFTVPANIDSMQIRLESIGGVSGGTNMVWLYNWNTGQYVLIGSAPLAISGNVIKPIVVRSADLPNYVGPGNQVKALVRGHLPIRPFSSQIPNPFTYRVDLLELSVTQGP